MVVLDNSQYSSRLLPVPVHAHAHAHAHTRTHPLALTCPHRSRSHSHALYLSPSLTVLSARRALKAVMVWARECVCEIRGREASV